MIGVVYVVIRRCKQRRRTRPTDTATRSPPQPAKRTPRHLSADETLALGTALLTAQDIHPPPPIHPPAPHLPGFPAKHHPRRPRRMHMARCVVCLEDFGIGEEIRRLACRHYFHAPCIDPWLSKRSATCPMCNYDVAAAFDRDKPLAEVKVDISRM
ncbi:hypothetical protein GGI15_004775 [Coemansia interrupta]|uniref:RING-type domain-containing protein n=1 Tax=Coemansia interrupta TaxID=1126814 RepID=A0A9W8H7D8_9FUNG|nr:hypothetical protein GGI15_004775 [Coemansia interrupta]